MGRTRAGQRRQFLRDDTDRRGGGFGTVFRISPGGSYTNFYSFGGPPNDGAFPHGTPMGVPVETFGGPPNDGAFPQAGLVQGSDGNFYGTTTYGGGGGIGFGTVFRISPSGSETNLYSFVGSPNDGANPQAGLVQGSDGNFYGTTVSGGSCNTGTVFRISPSGSETTLYQFGSSPNDGANPQAGLVQGSDGNFYGTTYGGGGGFGTVFEFSVPLSPPPNQISAIQRSGTNLIFRIPSIAGETYQLQYRSSMTSGIWSNIPNVSVTNSIGSILTLTNFAGANQPQGFYRFAITP